MNDADLQGLRIYNQFFTERGFILEHLNDGAGRMNLKGNSHKKAFETVKLNEDIVLKYDLFSDVQINLYVKEKHSDYIKAFEVFLRRKSIY